MKYVICTLLFWGVLYLDLSAENNNNVATAGGSALSVASDLINASNNRTKQLLAYQEFAETLRRMGIDPELCASHSSDKRQARKYLKKYGNDGTSPSKLPLGSCANPRKEGGKDWATFFKKYECRKYTYNQKKCTPGTTIEIVTWEIFKSSSDQAASGSCKEEKFSCYKKFRLAADAAKSIVEGNCAQCKALQSLKSSLDETLATIAALGGLATSIYGLTQQQQQQVMMSCEEKCKSAKDRSMPAFNDCMCTMSHTLPDGTSVPCRHSSECSPSEEDACTEQKKMMVDEELCLGSDCDYIECQCRCSAHSMDCDQASLKCVPAGSGTDQPDSTLAGYEGGSFKGGDSLQGLANDEEGSDLAASGASLPGASSGVSSTSGIDEKEEDQTEKAGFAAGAPGKGATGFAGGSPSAGYGEYAYSPDDEAAGSYGEEAGEKGIADSKEKSIWKLIEEVYEQGVVANKFLSAEYKDAKEPVKKNIKKGGKKPSSKKKV
jgi:hypothetical protein